MTTYYITISIVLLFAYLAQSNILRTENNLNNEVVNKKTTMTKLFFSLTVIVFIFVAGFRYYVGTDYGSYYHGYINYANSFFRDLKDFNEPGIKLIAKIVLIFNGNAYVFIFLCAMITNILFLLTIYKNTDMLLHATLLYVFLGCWHGAFNGIRQYLAAAIVFAGLRFIKERKFWKYALIVFIAFLFHASAILMIFPYFIAHNKISFPNIMLLVGASLIILFSFTEVLEFTGFLLQDDLTDDGAYITRSVNIFRVLVAIAPSVFFILAYQKRNITQDQKFWINMLIINGVMMFATSNSTYLARMGIYTAPFSVIGISELIKGINPKDKKLVTLLILLAFAVFWWYEVSKGSSLNNFTFIWQRKF